LPFEHDLLRDDAVALSAAARAAGQQQRHRADEHTPSRGRRRAGKQRCCAKGSRRDPHHILEKVSHYDKNF
jgi:hypothetical protein